MHLRSALPLLPALALLCGAVSANEGGASPFQIMVQIWSAVGVLVLYCLAGAALLTLGVLAFSLRPAPLRTITTLIETAPVRCGLLGAAGVLVLLLLLGVLGQNELLGTLAAVFSASVLWLGLMSSAVVLGKRVLFGLNSGKSDFAVWNLLTGGTLLVLAMPLPVLGWLAGILAILIGVGGLVAAPFASRQGLVTGQSAQSTAKLESLPEPH